jgi:hypothetical protein
MTVKAPDGALVKSPFDEFDARPSNGSKRSAFPW